MMLKRHEFAIALAILLATHREAAAAPRQGCRDCADEGRPKMAPLDSDPLGMYGGETRRWRDLQARRRRGKLSTEAAPTGESDENPHSDKGINRAKVDGAQDEATVADVPSPYRRRSRTSPSRDDTDAAETGTTVDSASPASSEGSKSGLATKATVALAENTTDDDSETASPEVEEDLARGMDYAPTYVDGVPTWAVNASEADASSGYADGQDASNVTEPSPLHVSSSGENSTEAEMDAAPSTANGTDPTEAEQVDVKEASEGNASVPAENEQNDTTAAPDSINGTAAEPPLSYSRDDDRVKSSLARSPTAAGTATKSEPSPSPNYSQRSKRRASRTSGTAEPPPPLTDSKDSDNVDESSIESAMARSRARSPTLSPTSKNARTAESETTPSPTVHGERLSRGTVKDGDGGIDASMARSRARSPTLSPTASDVKMRSEPSPSPNGQGEQVSRTAGTSRQSLSKIKDSGGRKSSRTTDDRPNPRSAPTRNEERYASRNSYRTERVNRKESPSRGERAKDYSRERRDRTSRSSSATRPSRYNTELGGAELITKEDGIGFGTLVVLGAAAFVGMFVRRELARLGRSRGPMDLPTSYDFGKMD